MRILLGSNALYYPAHGGGERSNRMLMEALAQREHACFVVTRIDRFGPEGQSRLREQLTGRGIQAQAEPSALRYAVNGVEVLAATSPASFRAFFVEHKNLFRPDVIVTSTDDPAQLLLEAALHDEHAATVFLTRATIALPFGPDAAFPSREKTETLKQADGIVGVSNYVAGYIREHSGIDAVHVPIALLERGPYPRVGRFDNRYVAMVNPCAVKGVKIFVALAKALPELAFAAVPTWGTTPADLEQIRAVPNIAVLPKADDINEVLRQTRVLLAPSVWAEARSRVVVEAMLAGVPVLASNLGGLPEAKMGVPYNLPVNPIQGYEQRLNEQFVPVADVPDQDIGPWCEALQKITSDRAHWDEISELSRVAALHYAQTTTIDPFESYIARLPRKPRHFASKPIAMPSDQLSKLSPERRRLLERKLKARSAMVNQALPFGGSDASSLRLFCFPHAGGAAAFFRNWREGLANVAEVAPVQYPGHENRRSEPFAQSMQELVQALLASLLPALRGSFAFLGHSMGAAVAFELIREFRRRRLILPRLFIASGLRAPQFRQNYIPQPDPSREELLEQIRRLGGLPEEALGDAVILETVLPALEADGALYRRYVYEPEPALDVPVLAVGGEADPNVNEVELTAWREQTTGPFQMAVFAGGHFYLRSAEGEFMHLLRSSLAALADSARETAAQS